AGANVEVVRVDGDRACGINLDGPQDTIASGAVVLGRAGDAGTDENSRLSSARLLLGPFLPDRMLLQLIQDLRGADRHDVGVSRPVAAAGLEPSARPQFDRIKRQRR